MMTTLVPVFRAFPSFTFLYGERRADACMPSGHFLFPSYPGWNIPLNMCSGGVVTRIVG